MNDENVNDDHDEERVIDEDGAEQGGPRDDSYADDDDYGPRRPSAQFGPPFGPGFIDALREFAEQTAAGFGGGPKRGYRSGATRHSGPHEHGPGRRHGHGGPGCGDRRGPGERGPGGWGPSGRGPGGRGPGGRGAGRRPGWPGDVPGFGGRPQRARKGDVRAAILSLLAEEPYNGYRLMKAIARMTGGAWRPSPGSIYPTLQQMLEEGLIASVGGEGNRSDYGLTDQGRSFVAEHAEDLRAAWAVMSGTTDEDLALQESIGKLIGAVRQAAFAASEEQSGRIAEILDDARRSIYRVLAD